MSNGKKSTVTVSVLLASATMILYGLLQGQNKEVFTKAIMICLECVGIGW